MLISRATCRADLAIWDNRLTLHAPPAAASTVGERLHHRVRLDGSAAANKDLTEFLRRRGSAARTPLFDSALGLLTSRRALTAAAVGLAAATLAAAALAKA